MFSIAGTVALALATGGAATAPATQTSIVSAEFGVLRLTPNLRLDFAPSRDVRLSAKEHYGWIMKVKTDRPRVHWHEEFTLPEGAPNWGVQPNGSTVVSADRRTAITDRDVEPRNGLISNFWRVADGDPKGKYLMKVTIDGEETRTFEFDVK
jgi:hypothetical protein